MLPFQWRSGQSSQAPFIQIFACAWGANDELRRTPRGARPLPSEQAASSLSASRGLLRLTWDHDSAEWYFDSTTAWWWWRWWRPWRGHKRRRRRRKWSRRTRRWVKVTKSAPAPGTSPTPGIECVTSAPGIAHTAHSPVIEYVALSPAVTDATPAPVRGDVAPSSTVTFNSVIEYVAPSPAAAHTAPTRFEHKKPAPAVRKKGPAPVKECTTTAPADAHAVPDSRIEHVAPTPAFAHEASTPATEYTSPSASPHLCDTSSSDRVRGHLTSRCLCRPKDRIRGTCTCRCPYSAYASDRARDAHTRCRLYRACPLRRHRRLASRTAMSMTHNTPRGGN